MSKPLDDIDVNFRRPEIGGRSLVFAHADEPPFALFGHECRDACTVDGCHSTRLFFYDLSRSIVVNWY